MPSRPRLIFSSIWAFDDLAIDEIKTKLTCATGSHILTCDYDKQDHVLVISGDVTSNIVEKIAEYIEEQRHKDLLEVPRIHQVEVPVMVSEDPSHTFPNPRDQRGELVAVEGGVEATVNPHVFGFVAKSWASLNGGLGCFAAGFRDILRDIGSLTETNIVAVDDIVGITVEGGNEDDVDDALAKITNVNKSLSGLIKPKAVNMIITHRDQFLRILEHGSMYPRKRVLADPSLSSNEPGQMFVTVALVFDPKEQVLRLPDNLLHSPRVSEEAKVCRIWNDFAFQEIGSGDDYLSLSFNEEGSHIYLTPEKVKEVNQWRAYSESAPQDIDLPQVSEPEAVPADSHSSPLSTPPAKSGPPGIKARRAKPLGQEIPKKAVPETPLPSTNPQETRLNGRKIWKETCSYGPDGLESREANHHAGSSSLEATLVTERGSASSSEQGQRRAHVKRAFAGIEPPTLSTTGPANSRSLPHTQGLANQVHSQRRIEAFERKHKYEARQHIDERATRQFHRTMSQQTANGKAQKVNKAKRQTTIEEAWGIGKSSHKETPAEPPKPRPADKGEPSTSQQTKQGIQAAPGGEAGTAQEDINQFFETIGPVLEVAELFPGILSLEFQVGLLMTPVIPKTHRDKYREYIPLDVWNKIFRPRGGAPAPTTKFLKRMTAIGSDADHIVNLKTSREHGNRHLFEQSYSDYSVTYEFHCLTKAYKPFVVVVEEDGKHFIEKPLTTMGAVNLHFPGHIWDARVALNGSIESAVDMAPDVEEAVQHLVDHIWVEPARSLLHIFTKLPPGSQFTVNKVLLKRWTRHRHIRPDEAPSKRASTDESSGQPGCPSAWRAMANGGSATEAQDIFLQITEIQDLLIGTSQDHRAMRARCAPAGEMTKHGRLWYEVTLVSPVIETILKANRTLEVGERTDDWRSIDLFGNNATFLCNDGSSGGDTPATLSPVATAVGNAGLGELFRLTKTVVEKIDDIGHWNSGAIETRNWASMFGFGRPAPPVRPALSNRLVVESKGFTFDEIESVKGVGSVTGDLQLKPSVEESIVTEEADTGYW
ncbi:hypothetical protein BDV59DRAFT_92189 [Aspergillus ambiguus]|uniref:uncharacterized protein n=1 Tax=Aspergillus ambiguus TaxID=176160 RepID=UPI003CCDA496